MVPCLARPRLRPSVASLTPLRLLSTREAINTHGALANLQRPTVARSRQTSRFSPPGSLPRLPVPSATDGISSILYKGLAHRITIDPPPPDNKMADAGDAVLRYESPTWLAIASGHTDRCQVRSPVIDMTKIKGPGSERTDATDSLQAVMAEVDPKTEILHIAGDVPTNDEWEALGQHFTSVRFLKVATGWEENWIDDKFPLNWPLELLIIADAISERITTPAIMEGRIKHLILLFTCGLRFEGPSVKELMKDAEVIFTIPRKKAPDAETQAEGEGGASEGAPSQPEEKQLADSDSHSATKSEPESDVIKVTSVPHEWNKWIYNKYAGKNITFSPDRGDAPPSATKTLEILGNDALQMLTYIALAKFHLLTSLESLTLLSAQGNDLQPVPADLFPCFLPGLDGLKHFKLTLGSEVHAKLLEAVPGNKPYLHAILPPNLETLRFRGPVSMAASHMDALMAAFADVAFLPRLKRMSLLLDLPDKDSEHPKEASLEQLRAAHATCRKVLDAAAGRGVVVEAFEEPWVEEHEGLFRAVDNRWAVLDDIARRK